MEIRRGQVWWWSCPEHKREHIQAGTRPVVIVSNDVCNSVSTVVTVVPMTTRVKQPYPQEVPVVFNGGVSIVLADQLTSLPVSELTMCAGDLRDFQMEQVDKAIAVQLGFIEPTSKPYTPFTNKNEGE